MINNIVPTPKKTDIFEDILTVPFCIGTEVPEWEGCCAVFATAFEKIYNKKLEIAPGGFLLKKDPSLPADAYVIEGTALYASSKEGILYALASLLPAVTVREEMTLENARIEDRPEKSYRSLMIDLAREWHPAYTIHHYIDLCFFLKINHLHLHFIDDQRYTLPSKAFPHITDGSRHYSYEEIAAMNAYAKERGITLIPEFEAPGHAKAMITNYPEVFGNQMEGDGGSIVTESGAVITAKNLVCAGSEKTMEGIRTLIGEICQLFPDTPYIHIGGDEANIKAWNYCTECKAYMAQNGIEDVYELYSDFVGRVARIVLEQGRTPIVWEGFPPKGVHRIPPETIVCAWESHYHLAPDLLKAGFKIINGSWQPLYIVPSLSKRWNGNDIMGWNVYNWQHFWVHSPARLNPINVAPTEQVLGAQYSVWECTYEQEIGRVMDNLPAFAERAWNVERLWDDETFNARRKPLLHLIPRLIQEV
ncbi:MAG: family 20 glycosylhydrolase [Clostridia bacterium]|nr:family 20 glycosylhydrolase [Clostridia bacterium]